MVANKEALFVTLVDHVHRFEARYESQDVVIFMLAMMTTQPITLPLVHVRGVMKNCCIMHSLQLHGFVHNFTKMHIKLHRIYDFSILYTDSRDHDISLLSTIR